MKKILTLVFMIMVLASTAFLFTSCDLESCSQLEGLVSTTYRIEFYNDFDSTTGRLDGLLIAQTVKKGEQIRYEGPAPSKTDDEYTYRFIGWDHELEVASKNDQYYAKYEKTKIEYTYTKHERVEPTCQAEGNIEYYERNDGKLFSDSEGKTEIQLADTVLAKVEHTLEHVVRVEPGEETDGNIEYWLCNECHKYFSDAECQHEISQEDIVLPATGPVPHQHSLTFVPQKDASCEEEGHKAYYSCECGKYFEDSEGTKEIEDLDAWLAGAGKLAKASHELQHVSRVEPGEETDGNIEYWLCNECHKYFSDAECQHEISREDIVLPATGPVPHQHSLTFVPQKDASCDEEGHKAYYSCACGKYFEDSEGQKEITDLEAWLSGEGKLDKVAHNLEHVVRVEPTELTAGNIEYWYCNSCNKYFSDAQGQNEIQQSDTILAATGIHNLILVPQKDSTCEEYGHKAYYSCACGKYFEDSEGQKEITDLEAWLEGEGKLDKVAHNLQHVVRVEPTELTAGNIEYWYCNSCNKYFSDAQGQNEIQQSDTILAATGIHNLILVPQVNPTCTSFGHKAYYSCACGKYFEDSEGQKEITDLEAWLEGEGRLAKAEHTSGSEYLHNSTSHWKVCSECGEKLNEEVHAFVEHIDDNGQLYRECSVCHYKENLPSHFMLFVGENSVDLSTTIDHDGYDDGYQVSLKNGDVLKAYNDEVILSIIYGENEPSSTLTITKDGKYDVYFKGSSCYIFEEEIPEYVFGLVINNNEENIIELINRGEKDGFVEWYKNDVELHQGDVIKAYNITSSISFTMSLDPASTGLEYNEGIVVLEDGTFDLCLKLKQDEDQLYAYKHVVIVPDVYKVAGSFNDWTGEILSANNDVYQIEVELKKNDEFKLQCNDEYQTMQLESGSEVSLTVLDSGNVKASKDGNYLISVIDGKLTVTLLEEYKYSVVVNNTPLTDEQLSQCYIDFEDNDLAFSKHLEIGQVIVVKYRNTALDIYHYDYENEEDVLHGKALEIENNGTYNFYVKNNKVYFTVSLDDLFTLWINGNKQDIEQLEDESNLAKFIVSLQIGQVLTVKNNEDFLKFYQSEEDEEPKASYTSSAQGSFTLYINEKYHLYLVEPEKQYQLVVGEEKTNLAPNPDNDDEVMYKGILLSKDSEISFFEVTHQQEMVVEAKENSSELIGLDFVVTKTAYFDIYLDIKENKVFIVSVEGITGEHTYGLVGSFNDWNEDEDSSLEEQLNGTYQIMMWLLRGEEFKVRTDGKWENEGGITLGYAELADSELSLGNKDGNVLVNKSGVYTIVVNPANKKMTVTYQAPSYKLGEEEMIDAFKENEGYVEQVALKNQELNKDQELKFYNGDQLLVITEADGNTQLVDGKVIVKHYGKYNDIYLKLLANRTYSVYVVLNDYYEVLDQQMIFDDTNENENYYQYKLNVELTKGDELVFKNNKDLLEVLVEDSNNNNVRLEDDKLVVICSTDGKANIYLKKYKNDNHFELYVEGYHNDFKAYNGEEVLEKGLLEEELGDNTEIFTLTLASDMQLSVKNNGVALNIFVLDENKGTSYRVVFPGVYKAYIKLVDEEFVLYLVLPEISENAYTLATSLDWSANSGTFAKQANNTYTYSIYLMVNDEFKVKFNDSWEASYGSSDVLELDEETFADSDGNIKLLKNGTVTITVRPAEEKKLTLAFVPGANNLQLVHGEEVVNKDEETKGEGNVASFSLHLTKNEVVKIRLDNSVDLYFYPDGKDDQTYEVLKSGDYIFYVNNSFEVYIQVPQDNFVMEVEGKEYEFTNVELHENDLLAKEVTLAVGDILKVKNNGDFVCQYEAQYEGKHTIYFTRDFEIYVVLPDIMSATKNTNPLALEDIKDGESDNKFEYLMELSIGDIITISNRGSLLHFYHSEEEEQIDEGTSLTATRNGVYKFYVNSQDHIYYSIPKDSFKMVINRNEETINAMLEKDSDVQYVLDSISLKKDDVLSFVNLATGEKLNVSSEVLSIVDGDMKVLQTSYFRIYLKLDENQFYIAKLDSITINEKAELIGSMVEWNPENALLMAEDGDNYRIERYLEKGALLKLLLDGSSWIGYDNLNGSSKDLVSVDDDRNIVLTKGGKYRITLLPQTAQINIEFLDVFTLNENAMVYTADDSVDAQYSYTLENAAKGLQLVFNVLGVVREEGELNNVDSNLRVRVGGNVTVYLKVTVDYEHQTEAYKVYALGYHDTFYVNDLEMEETEEKPVGSIAQYMYQADLTSGETLTFKLNDNKLDIAYAEGNVKLVDGEVVVICTSEDASIYLKVYEEESVKSYQLWVSGYSEENDPDLVSYYFQVSSLDGEGAKFALYGFNNKENGFSSLASSLGNGLYVAKMNNKYTSLIVVKLGNGEAISWENKDKQTENILLQADKNLFVINVSGEDNYQVDQYEYKDVTIILDYEDYEAIVKKPYQNILKPADPVKVGYTFDDWYLDDNKYVFTVMGLEDITLVPHFNGNQYQITLKNGEENVGNVDVTYGSHLANLTSNLLPEKENYTFAGYFTEANGLGDKYYDADGSSSLEYGVVGNTTLYAYFIQKLIVRFNAGEGLYGEAHEVINYYDYDSEALIVAPEQPTREGYSFVGYRDGDNEEVLSKAQIELLQVKTVTYNAVWEIIQFDITFSVDGNNKVVKTDYNTIPSYGEEVLKADDDKYYYSFIGWSLTANGEVLEELPKALEDKTYYARFTKEALYKVTVGENSYEMDSDNEHKPDGALAQFKYDGSFVALDEISFKHKGEGITFTPNEGKNNVIVYNANFVIRNDATDTIYLKVLIDDKETIYYEVWVGGYDEDQNLNVDYYFEIDDKWLQADAKVGIHAFGAGLADEDRFFGEPVEGDNIFKVSIPFNYTGFVLLRMAPEALELSFDKDKGLWNRSVDGSFEANKNYYKFAIGEGNWDENNSFTSSNIYKITWNVEGEKSYSLVVLGQKPTHDNPAKVDTVSETYAFVGWSLEEDGEALASLPNVSGDVTYYAVFNASARLYEISFVDYNNEVLKEALGYAYGTKASEIVLPETPHRDSDDEYDYEFASWSPLLSDVTGAQVYVATYNQAPRKYNVTITLANSGYGSVEQSAFVVDYNTSISANSNQLTIGEDVVTVSVTEENEQYRYTFTGFANIPANGKVQGDLNIVVNITRTTKKYTANFSVGTGINAPASQTVDYGTEIHFSVTLSNGYEEDNLTVVADEIELIPVDSIYSYTVTKDITIYINGTKLTGYTVELDHELTKVIFAGQDGASHGNDYVFTLSPKEGYEGTPVVRVDEEILVPEGNTYTITNVTSNKVIYIDETNVIKKKITITWNNDNNTLLKQTEVDYGDLPSYGETNPSKASTAQYTYTFNSWTPAVVAATVPTTYTATYTSTVNKYTITWKNGDDVLEVDENVVYGTMPSYDGEAPTKESDVQYHYTFNDTWSPEVVAVTGDQIYVAQFDTTLVEYTVTWSIRGEDTMTKVGYGMKPSHDDPDSYLQNAKRYEFNGWSTNQSAASGILINNLPAVVSNIKYYAIYLETEATGFALKVVSKDRDETLELTKNNDNHDFTEYYVQNVTLDYDSQILAVDLTNNATWTIQQLNSASTPKAKLIGESYAGKDHFIMGVEAGSYDFYLQFKESGDMIYIGSRDDSVSTNIQNGVILHAWNWSYNNILANMDNIYAAGYTAIQVAPVQESGCYWSTSDKMLERWWGVYQPLGFSFARDGHNWFGTKQEFINMTNAAHERGIKIIVDVVANHLANNNTNGGLHSNAETGISSYVRTYSAGGDGSLYDVVRGSFGNPGLPDLMTETEYVQNRVLSLLRECIDCGADGFRWDAAKHIETLHDWDYASEFWPNVILGATEYGLSKGVLIYNYGELINGTSQGRSLEWYSNYMSVTFSPYLSYGDIPYMATDKQVLWVESHDMYMDKYEAGATSGDDYWTINRDWAKIASRTNVASIYLARTYLDNSKKMGEVGEEHYKDASVAAVNNFHNMFVGASEYIDDTNYGNYTVERYFNSGSKNGLGGMVIINYGECPMAVQAYCHIIPDGNYVDKISGNKFTASNHIISGTLDTCGIAVLVPEEDTRTYTVIGLYGTNNWNRDDALNTPISMEAGNAWKVRGDADWNYAHGFSALDAESREFFKEDKDGNAEVLEDGKYIISVTSLYGIVKIHVEKVEEVVITFDVEGNTTNQRIDKGGKVAYDGETPSKASTAQYSYTFAGWKLNDEVVDLDEQTFDNNATLVAYFISTVNKYTVTWKNGEAILETDENVSYGTIPTYDGITPTKGADLQNTYTFNSWSPEVVAVTGNATYTATFTPHVINYTINFNANSGQGEMSPISRTYGEDTSIVNTFTISDSTKQFGGWSLTLGGEKIAVATLSQEMAEAAINNVITLYAVWEDKGKATITWTIEGVSTQETYKIGQMPEYKGDTPAKAADQQYTYTFSHWAPVLEEVSGNQTYTAVFNETVNQYTVTFDVCTGVEGIVSQEVDYGSEVVFTVTMSSGYVDDELVVKFGEETLTKGSDNKYRHVVTGNAVVTITGAKEAVIYTNNWYVSINGALYSEAMKLVKNGTSETEYTINVTLAKDQTFVITKDSADAPVYQYENIEDSGICARKLGTLTYVDSWETSVIKVALADTYTIYFKSDYESNQLWIVNNDYYFLIPNDNWKQSGARFAVYSFNNDASQWNNMSKLYDDLYYIKKTDLLSGYTTIIFCRMNGSSTVNNWNGDVKWNQTDNLTDIDNSVYQIDGWDKSGHWL